MTVERVLMEMKSPLNKQFIIAEVNVSPPSVTFLPPISLVNQTTTTLRVTTMQVQLKQSYEMSIEPGMTVYLPFHFIQDDFSIQLSSPSTCFSKPVLFSSLSTKHPVITSCELPLEANMIALSSVWSVCLLVILFAPFIT